MISSGFKLKNLLVFCFVFCLGSAQAQLSVHQLNEGVFALVGELTQRSADNLANNSTHGFVVTEDGVILIDSGGSYLGAQQIHQTIQGITDKPIKYVINTGGQDHRWFGNEYFQALGAETIASSAARDDQLERADAQMSRLSGLIGESLENTTPVPAVEVFETSRQIELGGVRLELHHFGAAHTAGDLIVWMPENRVMFSGDIVFNNRMLGVGPAQDILSWIDVFEQMASFEPEQLVPGHGAPSDLATATRNTYDYLVYLKEQVVAILESGGDMQAAVAIDQSAFHYLLNHESIAGKNAQWVYEQLEFDY